MDGPDAARVVVHPPPAPWRRLDRDGCLVWLAGDVGRLGPIVGAVAAGNQRSLAALLTGERSQFGLIVETPDSVIAAVDRVHGYPLHLRQHAGCVEIAADTGPWLTPENAAAFDERQAELFILAGYCIGRATLLNDVTRLLPGEYAWLMREDGALSRERYYRFAPTFDGAADETTWRARLGDALDAAIGRVLRQASGGRIWIPLSAGFDSRLVLAKLLEHGCKDIHTFSYGTPGNMEGRVAASLAERAGVPWRFVAVEPRAARADFHCGEGARYSFVGGGLRTSPVFNEFFAFQRLVAEGDLGPDDLVTNGQSGDYLTGGHIPAELPEKLADVAAYIRQKHMALFRGRSEAFGQAGAEAMLRAWIAENSGDVDADDPLDLLRLYLAFEWQERQCQFVVNQQRAYDFLGLRWSLPLWDADLMDLFTEVPLALQRNQALYISYLEDWNFGGLFDPLRLPYDPWPRGGSVIRGLGRLAGVAGGTTAKDAAYRRLYYFSDYRYLYQLFGWRCFQAFCEDLRTPASLIALDYLLRLRHRFDLPPVLAEEKKLAHLLRPAPDAGPASDI